MQLFWAFNDEDSAFYEWFPVSVQLLVVSDKLSMATKKVLSSIQPKSDGMLRNCSAANY